MTPQVTLTDKLVSLQTKTRYDNLLVPFYAGLSRGNFSAPKIIEMKSEAIRATSVI